MTLETKSKKIKDMTDREILEVIQSFCKHRRRTVVPESKIFSEEGHNFLQCLDCGKCFYEELNMERKKLFVTFKDSNIDIKTEDGDINIGIPYRFDIETGEQNLKRLLWQLGFDVEIKKGDKNDS